MIRTLVSTVLLLALAGCKPAAVGAGASRAADDAGRTAVASADEAAGPDFPAAPAAPVVATSTPPDRTAEAPPPTEPAWRGPMFEYPLRLVGTEPFWGGRIARDGITISGADRPDARFPYRDPVVTGAGARWTSQSVGAFPLEVTLVRDPCSDGMSDKRYPFQATVVLGKETLKGCAIREAEFGGER